MNNQLAHGKLVTSQKEHITPLLLLGFFNDSFSSGWRQDMSNQLTIRQEQREDAVLERQTKREAMGCHLTSSAGK